LDSCINVDSSRNVKKILNCMCLIYYNKWKIKLVNNGFNILKMTSLTLIIENMWKKSQIHFNINVGFKIVTCVLINYGKCKMQLLINGFNMLKVDNSTHVPCRELKKCQKIH
jgi:hypothetical protein